MRDFKTRQAEACPTQEMRATSSAAVAGFPLIVSARSTRPAPPILHPILAFLLLLVELFLLLVVEQRANLIVRVLADLHHFLAHRLPVAAGIVSHIFHLLLRVHENRLDLRLLVGRQIRSPWSFASADHRETSALGGHLLPGLHRIRLPDMARPGRPQPALARPATVSKSRDICVLSSL